MEMPKAYNPFEHEEKIYQEWQEQGLFNPDNLKGKPFSIMMPPPNVTGVLHLGHALENSLMDTMARYQRLQGKKVLLLPGVDHAAVATQAKVEKLLIQNGLKNPRQELGREKLLKKVQEFADDSRHTILKQIKKMGTSCDWSRFAYTLDEKRGKAVNTVFEKMYNDGLIYRGHRVVNWSVKGQSTCSDDELEYVDRMAKLYTFKYSADFPITIATTRPETKLGDTAVAVNPEDERYQEFIGQQFEVDFCGNKLTLKVIADPEVDPEYGTGALGVTPAHSPVDFEMYEKQKAKGEPIELIPVIDQHRKMTEQAGADFVGLTTEEAREKVIEKLKEKGLFISQEEIEQSVGTSDRFGDVVEALPMTQWFVSVNKKIPGRDKSLKELMRAAVKTGLKNNKDQKVDITPKRFEKIYFQWIDNLRDWCISRQIWFGHRIPVWYKDPQTLTMFRHGQAQSNKSGLCDSNQKNRENNLTEKGKKQVSEAAEELQSENFDLIITSDFPRAKQTAEILADKLNISKIVEDHRIGEVGMGDFNGKKEKDFTAFRKENFDQWHKGNPENIESFFDLKKRIFDFLDEVKEKYQDKNVLVVAHGDSIRVAGGYERGLSDKEIFELGYPDNAGWTKINLQSEEIRVSVEGIKDPAWQQDPDTLDTWFSSGLWTFSTLGWPEKTLDLKTFHPSSWMQMGYELLFFWMARMILMSSYVMEEIPFKNVYIHGMLRDKHGQKFSKSAGNGIDPIEVADKYGADALRWALLIGTSPGNDSAFFEEKVESARNMVNKLWNISRFILMDSREFKSLEKEPKAKTLSDKWILSRFNRLNKKMQYLMTKYNFSAAGEELRDFTWNELADWYVEISKTEENKKDILNYLLKNLLILWHPFVPFVTQSIWNNRGEKQSLMTADWPKINKKSINEKVEKDFEQIKEIIVNIRNLRSEYKLDPGKKLEILYNGQEELVEKNKKAIKFLAKLKSLDSVEKKPDRSAGTVAGLTQIYLPLADLIDFDHEKKSLNEEKDNLQKYLAGLGKKLNNENFVNNAPEEVVQKEKQKKQQAEEKLKKINKKLTDLQ